jgi:hypothetical protein
MSGYCKEGGPVAYMYTHVLTLCVATVLTERVKSRDSHAIAKSIELIVAQFYWLVRS